MQVMDRGQADPRGSLAAKAEEAIMATWKTQGPPLVSICCATFNHANYLGNALDGFLSQETDFPFEIVIRDDASSDGTAEIACEYARRYPRIVRTYIETENQFSRGVRPLHVWPTLARGELIALCEGDDFWMSPRKLQQQVDLLAKHPVAVMSVAGTDVYQQMGDALTYVGTHLGNGKKILSFDDMKHQYFHTSTYVIRAGVLKELVNRYFLGQTVLGDTALRFILVSRGPFVLLPEVVSVYRQTGEGTWTSLGQDRQLEWEMASTRKLLELLSGELRNFQGERLFFLLSVACVRNLQGHKIVEGMKLLPDILKCGIRYKLTGYARRRFLGIKRLFCNG